MTEELSEPLYIVGEVENGKYIMPFRDSGYSGMRIYRRLGMAKQDQKKYGGHIYTINKLVSTE